MFTDIKGIFFYIVLKESGKTIKITLRRASALPNELDYNRWRE